MIGEIANLAVDTSQQCRHWFGRNQLEIMGDLQLS